MSKVRVLHPTDDLPIHVRPVMLALSKAHAAAVLADICAHDADYLQMPGSAITAEEEVNVRAWIQGFATDALYEAIREAERDYRAEHAPRSVGP